MSHDTFHVHGAKTFNQNSNIEHAESAAHKTRARCGLKMNRWKMRGLGMRGPKIRVSLLLFVLFAALVSPAQARKKRRPPASGRAAVVVDERLAALRDAPSLSANLLRRLGRGRYVSVTGEKSSGDGVTFYRVAVTRRTAGWIQSDAVVRPARAGDDERLLKLIRGSEEFERLARSRIFLDAFPRSPLRPTVLLVIGDAAEDAAQKLTREAQRRLDAREIEAGSVPPASYFLNYSGLDRYNRNGVKFVFDPAKRQLHYDGAAWREILRRHPRSPEAVEARKRLEPQAAPSK